ncbi:cobalamin-dependent protein, partial [Thermodesulfobacteriota bacterium]
MRVLLISANTEQFNMPAMPLGLACVAEATKRAGHEVIMLDLMFRADVSSTLKDAISETQPECIGISVRNIDDQCSESPQFLIEKVKQVVTVCRTLSASPIVLGGAGYSMFPESALAYLEADYGVAGEGEMAFTNLLTLLHKN